MTEKEKIKFFKLLYKNKTLTRKQLYLTFGERTDDIIQVLCFQRYIILCNPVNISGVIQKSDDNIFKLSDKGIDYIEEVQDKQKENIYTWLWRLAPIIISLYSLYKSSNKV